jgi:tRNA threonylcarbamoyladenosine biosynthesis protein TsaE
MKLFEKILNSEQESCEFINNFAKTLNVNDIILLFGELGAGKTYFCREIIKFFCGKDIKIISPTFNILQTYQAQDFTIYHYDLYRIKSPTEFHELGIEEAIQNSLLLIEWPELIENLLPKPLIKINLQLLDDEKRACIINLISN